MSGQYHRSHSRAWFLERPGYIRFMIRELTSVVVGAYLVVLIATLGRAALGGAALAEWLQTLGGTGWMIAHGVALVAAMWHSVTWFQAVPQAMPIFIGERKLGAPVAALLMGYGPWLTVTAVVVWWAVR